MAKIRQAASTLEDNGKVLLSRESEEDPILADFLNFLANDIKNNPLHVQTISPTLVSRMHSLTADMDIDLDAPLNEKDG